MAKYALSEEQINQFIKTASTNEALIGMLRQNKMEQDKWDNMVKDSLVLHELSTKYLQQLISFNNSDRDNVLKTLI